MQGLHRLAELPYRPGARVLVIGGAGGIGADADAVQLARLAGAHVTATARPTQQEFVTTLGAHDVLDRTDLDLARTIRGWDVVLDTPGAFRLADLRHTLARDGCSCRPEGSPPMPCAPRCPLGCSPPAHRRCRPDSRPLAGPRAPRCARRDRGELTVPVAGVHPLAAAAEAHCAAEGHACGKVVVQILDT